MLGTLSDQIYKKIRSVMPVFKHVSELTGVHPYILAGVWYRESLSIAPPKTPGGPFQFDPPLSGTKIASLLKARTNLTAKEIEVFAHKGVNDFETAAFCAAAFLQEKVNGRLTLNPTDSLVKDAFWAYNGRAYGSVEKSPYVMNNYDADHKDLRIIGTIPNPDGTRKKINVIDRRFGAFTIYKYLRSLDV